MTIERGERVDAAARPMPIVTRRCARLGALGWGLTSTSWCKGGSQVRRLDDAAIGVRSFVQLVRLVNVSFTGEH